MSGGYDLYGNYYPNRNDACAAEIAQCNEIDNRINSQEISKLKKQVQSLGRTIPDDIKSLLTKIANSDNAMYREESRKLIRKYFN